jgi:hypothetical protein
MLGIGVGGFIVGQLVFVGAMRWFATVYEIAKDPTNAGAGGKAGRIAIASVFGSGPWLIAAAAWVAYFVHDEPYALPLFVGELLAFAFFVAITLYFTSKRGQGKNAA